MDSHSSDGESSTDSEHPFEESTQNTEAENSKREKIREKLSKMSFEDVLKLKEKIGAKMYNQVVLGVKPDKTKTNFKRANKNRPREMSSKIRVNVKTQNTMVIPSKKKVVARDPRFDSMCGEYDEKSFRENYKFINDIRKKDKKELEKELSVTVDPDRKKQIKFLIQRLTNQIREAEKKEQLEQHKLEESRELREKLSKGEKPKFRKKSEKKVTELLNKYEDLKKSNKLQKHIEKRQKKMKKPSYE